MPKLGRAVLQMGRCDIKGFSVASRNVDVEAFFPNLVVGVEWANKKGVLTGHKSPGLRRVRHVAVRFY